VSNPIREATAAPAAGSSILPQTLSTLQGDLSIVTVGREQVMVRMAAAGVAAPAVQ